MKDAFPFHAITHLEALPARARLLLLAGIIGLYGALFFFLYSIFHSAALTAFSLLPVAVAGWLFGLRGGALAGLLAIPANLLLLRQVNQAQEWERFIQDGTPGALILILLGTLFGYANDLRRNLHRQLDERRKAEINLAKANTILREDEKKLRNIIEQSSEGMALTNEEGQVVEWNQSMAVITGLQREQVLGRPIWDIRDEMQFGLLKDEESNEQVKEAVRNALRGGQTARLFQPYSIQLHRRDGTLRYIDGLAYPINTERGFMIGVVLRDTTESRDAEKAERAQRILAEALRATAEALTSSIGLEKVLDCILTNLERVVPHDAANIMLVEDGVARMVRWHKYKNHVSNPVNTFKAVFKVDDIPNFRRAAQSQKPVLVADSRQSPEWREFKTTGWIRSNVIVPVMMEDRLLGFINVDSATPNFFTQTHTGHLQMFAYQAAIALNNARLFADLKASHDELTQAYDATIEGWAMALDLRDQDTQWHTRRVVNWTMRLAKAVNIPEEDWALVRRGAILHDIGKISVPDAILQKPGPLDAEEMLAMRLHPIYALRMLSGIHYLQPALDIPYCHHEKWDGSGYPRGLMGEEIPLAARIFAIVDVWDALISDRVYRKAWSQGQALEYIRDQSGKHFDPRLVDIFLDMVRVDAGQ